VASKAAGRTRCSQAAQRQLIVNADDFGQSYGINRGIYVAIERGIVTSVSLMVRWPAAEAVVELMRRWQHVSVGLHVDLGEWRLQNGSWVAVYEVEPADDHDAVAAEVERQLAAFRRLTGNDPTHLDSHQHVHLQEPVRSAVIGLSERLRIPARHFSPLVRPCGAFYGQSAHGNSEPSMISVDSLMRILQQLPPGVTELGCHPGFADDIDSMYRAERKLEVHALCAPDVRDCIAELGIELCSFHTIVEGHRS
jgi:predicted glycoside hydrolase/deacetylase ChbG (UPF0249 family)